MKVKKLSGKVQDARQIPTLFDNENITYHPINIVNWKEYPYQPQVHSPIFSSKVSLPKLAQRFT